MKEVVLTAEFDLCCGKKPQTRNTLSLQLYLGTTSLLTFFLK